MFDSVAKTVLIAVLCLGAMSALAQPANDDFANRAPIPARKTMVAGSLAHSTSQIDEPLLEGVSSGQTAWWSWTAPANGLLTLAPRAQSFNPLLTVFTGGDLADLALAASNNYVECYSDGDCGCHWRMRDEVSLHVRRGQTYQIAFDSPIVTDASMQVIAEPFYPDTSGADTNDIPSETAYFWGAVFTTNIDAGDTVSLGLHFVPAPANDDFANATRVFGSRFRFNASNAGATKQAGEPDHAGNSGGSSVWFVWTAPATGRVTLSTNEIAPYAPPSWWGYFDYGAASSEFYDSWWPPDCGDAVDQNPPPQFFPLLASYAGTSVASLSSNYQAIGLDAYPYGIEFDAIQGTTYHFAYDGNMGTTNGATILLAVTKPAINATFAARIAVQGTYVAISGYNAGASKQPAAPDIGNGSTGKCAWWSWFAPVRGDVTIDLAGSDYTFPVAVFTGSKLSGPIHKFTNVLSRSGRQG